MEFAVYMPEQEPQVGQALFSVLLQTRLVQLAGVVRAYRLEHVAQAGTAAVIHGTGHHRTAGDEDGGDIHPGGGHEQAGYVLCRSWGS